MYLLKSRSVAIFAFCFLSIFAVTSAQLIRGEINYSPIPNDFKYDSVVEALDETLQPIYDFSKDFIDATIPVNVDNELWGDVWEWDRFVEDYSGFLSYVIIMVVIGLLIPIIGLIFCCSRCCCNCCGAKAYEKHPKQGPASIIIAGGYTIVFSAFLIFAIVVGMRSNVVMEQGAENVFGKIIVTLRDVGKYSGNTFAQMHYLMTNNYQEFSDGLSEELEAIGDQLEGKIDVRELDEIKSGLTNLRGSITDLKGTDAAAKSIQNAKSAMDETKIKTLAIAEACSSNTNPEIKAKCEEIVIAGNDWTIPPFDFPDLSATILQMENFDLDVLQAYLDGLKAFGQTLSTALRGVSGVAKDNTAEAGAAITKQLMEVKDQIESIQEWMEKIISDIEDAQGYYNDYGKLRYGLTFLLPLILIFVVIFVILGFLIGMCCRPAYYKEKGCGNASVASDFFMINTSLIFIFTFVFAVAICGYYAFGLLGQRFICNTFDTMDNVKGLKFLDDNLDVAQYFGDGVTMEHLLKSCNANKPVYEVFVLKNVIDLDEIVKYLDDYQIKSALKELNDAISKQIKKFDTAFNKDLFIELKKVDLDSIQVPMYEDAKNKMEDLAKLLEDLLGLEPGIVGLPDVINEFTKYIGYFDDLQTSFGNFQTNIKMGGTATVTYQQRLVEFDTYLDNYYKSITKGDIPTVGNQLTDASILTVETYLNRIKDQMINSIGLCQPASIAVKATLNEACGNVFNPMNAFWLANLFALVAFIPLLIIFIHLVSYFRQYIMTDEDRYRQENYYHYNPPGTRGSAIEVHDVRAHHQPNPDTDLNQQPLYPAESNVPSFTQSTPLPPIPPNHFYNPNSGSIAASPRGPLYPSLASNESEQGNNALTSAAELAGGGMYMKNGKKTALGEQGRNVRRQQEYPFAMKGTSIASDANGSDQYTRF